MNREFPLKNFSAILTNNNLSEIEQLQYLQLCVRVDDAKLISGFSLQPENLNNCRKYCATVLRIKALSDERSYELITGEIP